jgi:hypothetical protein
MTESVVVIVVPPAYHRDTWTSIQRTDHTRGPDPLRSVRLKCFRYDCNPVCAVVLVLVLSQGVQGDTNWCRLVFAQDLLLAAQVAWQAQIEGCLCQRQILPLVVPTVRTPPKNRRSARGGSTGIVSEVLLNRPLMHCPVAVPKMN